MRKYNGKSNICGNIIEKYRLEKGLSREEFAQKLQLAGLNIDRTHVLRIEKGKVVVKDFELIIFCEILGIEFIELKKEIYKNKE